MYSSDNDSEGDRKAYGQYASLDANGSDVDDDAAAYLCAVRDEAAKFPDVMIAANPQLMTSSKRMVHSPRSWGTSASSVILQRQLTASPQWIFQFLRDFAELRQSLKGLEHMQCWAPHGHPFSAGLLEAECGHACPDILSLDRLMQLPQEHISQLFDETVDWLVEQRSVTPIGACKIFSLSAVLDYPLGASTDASMAKLARHCWLMLSCVEDFQGSSMLEVLLVIAGAYFGQDEDLHLAYVAFKNST